MRTYNAAQASECGGRQIYWRFASLLATLHIPDAFARHRIIMSTSCSSYPEQASKAYRSTAMRDP